ncbi:MAG: RCC1 domain-containing protein, partial [Thermoleophilaceae bacterium]
MGDQPERNVRRLGRARARGGGFFAVALVALATLAIALPGGVVHADQSSQPLEPAAAQLDAGRNHTCAMLADGEVRCWGFNREGELGYANRDTIGDDETPAAAGPVDLGEGRTAKSISAGDFHTCAILDDDTVRCWGFGGNGRLGYGSQSNVGDDETPGSVGPVDLGTDGEGRALTAKSISAGGSHTCAILDDDSVRCWGYAFYGQLGYGNPEPTGDPPVEPNPLDIGDTETPGSVGPVDLGAGPVTAISAGGLHTCAILQGGDVRCWGNGAVGRLGYASEANIGDRDTPASAGSVDIGLGRTAKAIAAGDAHTCAVLDNAAVRCWGFNGNGRLGYGNSQPIGDTETPGSVEPVVLGSGAKAIGAGRGHTCALLDGGAVRCWGFGGNGRLGYGNVEDIGDDELPASAGPVDLGMGGTARAITLGGSQTCARLDDEKGSVRCWGYGGNGRLGLCSEANVGDDESPASVGVVDLGDGGQA